MRTGMMEVVNRGGEAHDDDGGGDDDEGEGDGSD
jgi:hypothetical protein